MPDAIVPLDQAQISRFNADGFLIAENLIDRELVARLTSRIEPLFKRDFETGIYPDEWHWRPGLSLPDVTRQIGNAWKSDLTVARVVLSAEIGRISATLAGWPGACLIQDSIWVKPPGAREIALHQDGMYYTDFAPTEVIACWIALDDTSADAGTLEYVKGSHKWPRSRQVSEFHVPTQDYRTEMQQAAAEIGVSQPEIVPIEVSAGSCVFHHWNIWHGSGINRRPDKIRRSLSVFTAHANTCFQPTGAGYIHGRYKRFGETSMDEKFFPILWTQDQYRTRFLAHYCEDALAKKAVITSGKA